MPCLVIPGKLSRLSTCGLHPFLQSQTARQEDQLAHILFFALAGSDAYLHLSALLSNITWDGKSWIWSAKVGDGQRRMMIWIFDNETPCKERLLFVPLLAVYVCNGKIEITVNSNCKSPAWLAWLILIYQIRGHSTLSQLSVDSWVQYNIERTNLFHTQSVDILVTHTSFHLVR